MSILVTDHGFATAKLPDDPNTILDLPGDTDPDALAIGEHIALVRVAFAGFADGRGFTLARRLRQAGYGGRLHAVGHVLPDQYSMARRVGFDAVEIDAARAARQPEADWVARADWLAESYQSRLQGQTTP